MIVIEELKEQIWIRKAKFSDIQEVVYMLLHLIPLGKVTTYKSIAKVLSVSPRVIGMTLKMNKKPIIIPCHRVIYSNRALGGYSIGGAKVKERLLKLEGVSFCYGNKICKKDLIDLNKLI